MKRLEIRYRPSALADIEDLEFYLFERGASLGVIETYVGRLRDRIEKIGDAPYASRARDDLEPGLRTVVFEGRIVIAFFASDDLVEITNLLSHGRDYEALYDAGRGEEEG